MSNGLLYIAGLIVLALATLFAVPHFIDWNGYRGVFEEKASRILGREVRVGGDVNVRLLPAPFVRFEKLRIADTTATSGEPFFRAESFTMRLSVPPLLKGIIEANEIELKRPELRLAVDAEGVGNWRTLSIAPGSLPFVPADVTLQSVKIKDGVVALHGPKGIGFAELKGLNGELKAESIDGPFSFRGTAQWQGADREIRVATTATDAAGAIRFKATVRGERLANVYTVDGRIADLKERPRIEGEVTAKLELDALEAVPATSAESGTGKGEHPLLDFKASLAGDARGLKMDDIALTFERLGQPQLITGSASASWADALNVELNLASRWLDLDRISGSEGAQRPFDTARSFVSSVMQALPTEAETKARFDLDQANLGGEPVSGIRMEVVRTHGALLVKDLRAGLPGGVKLTLDGTVADAPDAQAFRGELALRGASLARFLAWAVKDQAAAIVPSDGPFSLHGRLALSDKAVDLTEAGAEIAGTPLTGAVHYVGGEHARLAVVLEGHEVDGAKLWPAGVGYFKRLLASEAPDGAKEPAADAQQGWLDLSRSELALRLRAGRLLTGHAPLRDVDMDLAVRQGGLSVQTLRFTTEEGLELELEGGIADAAGRPRGVLRWVAAARGKGAYASFVRLMDLPEDAVKRAMHYADLAPMRLAGTLRLGERGERAADIALDGSIEGGRIVAAARLDGGLADWRRAGADLALTIESADVVRTLDTLAARRTGSPAEPRDRAGEIFLKAVGTPTAGLLATASIKAPGLLMTYDGRIALPEDGGSTFDGEARVSSRELGDVLAVAGLGSGGNIRGAPVVGTFKLASSEHAIEIKPQGLTVGASKVSGTAALAYPEDGPAILTAQLEVDKASIPALLGLVLDGRTTQEADAEPLAQGKVLWPEHPFDFAALDGIEGKLGVTFEALSLQEGMAIEKARLEAALAPGKVAVTRLEGKALGGDVLVQLTLERAPGGASLAGDVRLSGVRLDGSGPAAAQDEGASALTLEFSGRGSTPGALIAVATGKGEVSLGKASVHVPTPLAVVATSEAVLTGAAGGSGDDLIAALRAQIAASEVVVGPRKIAVDISDGAAKLAPFTLESTAGTTRVETTVDLASLTVDSAWLLEPRAPDVEQPDRPRKGALPPVNVVYVGPLKDGWSLEPRFTTDQLQRELAIRKLELDADELERLHRLDVERARQEEERRRALEADQGRTATDAPAPSEAAPEGAADQAPGVPQAGVPPLPPTDTSGSAAVVPAPPGAEPQAETPQQQQNDAAADPLAPQGTVGTIAPATPGTPRPRRARQHSPAAGEQVLRALQNNTN